MSITAVEAATVFAEQNLPSVNQLIVAGCWIIGLALVSNSLFKAARAANAASGHGHGDTFGGAIMSFVVGICMVAFTDVIGTGMGTLGADSSLSILSYVSSAGGEGAAQVQAAVKAAFAVAFTLGLVSVAKGLMICDQWGNGRTQRTLGEAGVFIVSGVMLCNMDWATCMVTGSFGYSVC